MSAAFFVGFHQTLIAIATASRWVDKVKHSDKDGVSGEQSQGQGTLSPYQNLRLLFKQHRPLDELIAALLKGHQPSINYLLNHLNQLGNSHLQQICKALTQAALKGTSIAEQILTKLYHAADTSKQTAVIASTVVEESQLLYDKIVNNPPPVTVISPAPF